MQCPYQRNSQQLNLPHSQQKRWKPIIKFFITLQESIMFYINFYCAKVLEFCIYLDEIWESSTEHDGVTAAAAALAPAGAEQSQDPDWNGF